MELINVKLFIGISSNINEVIRAVFIIFLQKDFACTKNYKKVQKSTRAQEHKKAPKARKHHQAKVQSANKRTKKNVL